MDYKVINLKLNSPSIDEALAILELELEIMKLEGVKVAKIIHGYGSHGVGGVIAKEVRNILKMYKKQHKIKDFLLGNEWDMSNKKCFDILVNIKDYYDDEDLNRSNPGITIVIIQ